MKKKLFIGIDVGGTNISAALVTYQGVILSRRKYPTPRKATPKEILFSINSIVKEILKEIGEEQKNLEGIGIGIPGIVDPQTGEIVVTPNIDMGGLFLAGELEERFHVKVAVGNDVNLGLLGEDWLGAARDAKNVVGLFLGTGLGGGIIVDGKLYTGNRGFGAELGHMIIDINGPMCTCGNKGCIEAMVGRWAIERDIQKAVKNGQKTILTELAGGNLNQIKSKILRKALKQADPLVTEIMTRVSEVFGKGCLSLLHTFDPEVFVLGGGVIEACGDFIIPRVKKILKKDPFMKYNDDFQVVQSVLGDDAITLGAVALTLQSLGLDLEQRTVYPQIQSTQFGEVTINNERYSYDIFIRVNGKIKKRDKKIAKELFGTSHKICVEELKKVCKKSPELLIIGSGQQGMVELTSDGKDFLKKEGIDYEIKPTPQAIQAYNEAKKRKTIILHVTC